jgi:Protein of unknown function (DUF1353)
MNYSLPLDTRYDAYASALLGKDHWRVLTPFSYKIDEESWVTIPKGYLTDGASVPRLFWNMIPPWGPYGQAAVVHDLLCEYLSVVRNGRPVSITRAECDQLLNQAMKNLDVNPALRWMIYSAVCAYRITLNVSEPTATLLKRRLEAEWRE